MYCAYCGGQIPEGAAFCGHCGKPVIVLNPAQTVAVAGKGNTSSIEARLSKGYKVGGAGASLALLCFFLPWILVSCGSQTTRISGWGLAAGTSIRAGYTTQPIDGSPILFLVLFAAVGAAALAYFAYKRGRLNKIVDGFGLIAIGVAPLLILLLQFEGYDNSNSQMGIIIELQFGLWGTVLGYLAVITGGVLNLRE